VNLELSPAAGDAGTVDVSLDDAGFNAPIAAEVDNGAWGATVPVDGLASGTHTLYVKATQAGKTTTVSRTFSVTRGGSPRAVVQVQIVKANAQPKQTGWVNAVDTSGNGSWSSWVSNLDITTLPKGSYTLRSRLLLDNSPVATGAPVKFNRR
jgi:hypothetical protein